jgi:hypothetical protein
MTPKAPQASQEPETPMAPMAQDTSMPPDDSMDQSMMQGGNVDPQVARYLPPDCRCQGCIHFIDPGSCEIVAGPIDPQAVCSLYTPDANGQETSEESPDYDSSSEAEEA